MIGGYNVKRVITGWDIYRMVSVIATFIVGVLLVVDMKWDIGEHSFLGLLALCFLNIIISFWGIKMNRKILKLVGCGSLIIVILAVIGAGYLCFTKPICVFKQHKLQYSASLPVGQQLTKQQVEEDTKQLIEMIERTHPIFLEEVPEGYEKAKEELLKATQRDMTVGDLELLLCKYLTSLQDGHTILWLEEEAKLNIEWKYKEGKLILLDEQNKFTDKIITEVNSIPIENIIEMIRNIFPAENEIADCKNIERYARDRLILTKAGVDCSQNIVLTVMQGSKQGLQQAVFMPATVDQKTATEISSKIINTNTFYVKFATCEVNAALEEVVVQLKEAISKGTQNVIIDVRDNGGGDSTACLKLVEAMGMKPGNFGAVIRFSPLAQERYGYIRKNGFITVHRSNTVEKNDKVHLYILTNENTFSSAQWLATWVKDGRLGTLVGSPSSNMPSSFGDVLNYQLNHSKLVGGVSYKKFTRPDANKDAERILNVDIEVKQGEDALEKTLQLIQ